MDMWRIVQLHVYFPSLHLNACYLKTVHLGSMHAIHTYIHDIIHSTIHCNGWQVKSTSLLSKESLIYQMLPQYHSMQFGIYTNHSFCYNVLTSTFREFQRRRFLPTSHWSSVIQSQLTSKSQMLIHAISQQRLVK